MPAIPLITAGLGAATTALSAHKANVQSDTNNQLVNQRQASEQAATAAQTQLQQRKFGSDQAMLALQNALKGGLLQGLQDTTITPPASIAAMMPKITGGLRPSAITGREKIGADLQRQALLNLMQPNQAGNGPMPSLSQSTDMVNVPAAGLPAGSPALPKEGGFAKFLNFALPAASLATGVYSALKKPRPGNAFTGPAIDYP